MTPHTTTAHPIAGVAPRRVLATRNASWAKALARWLGRAYVRPDSISVAGVVFAAAGCAAFVAAPDVAGPARVVALLLAAASIQLRLLCNLLDGMLAVEEGFKTKTGDLYNELPDRIEDVVLLVGAGYSLRDLSYGPALGWLAAIAAVFTAYVRVMGGSLGVPQPFVGPMAKQHRMFMLTVCSLFAAVESIAGGRRWSMCLGLVVIIAGSIVTAARRVLLIVSEVEAR